MSVKHILGRTRKETLIYFGTDLGQKIKFFPRTQNDLSRQRLTEKNRQTLLELKKLQIAFEARVCPSTKRRNELRIIAHQNLRSAISTSHEMLARSVSHAHPCAPFTCRHAPPNH